MASAKPPPSEPFSLWAVQPVRCPLGEIVLAGTKWGSQATYAYASPPSALLRTPYDVVVYTLEGEADYTDDTGLKACLTKGSLLWARKGVGQSYGPRPGSRWSELFVRFGGPVFDAWQANGFPGSSSRLMTLEPFDHWVERLREVIQPASRAPAESPLLRLCRFQQILAAALQSQETGRQTAASSAWRDEACRKLAEGTLLHPALPEIAAAMNISYSLFRKRFLKLTGKTPGQYRSEEILRRAGASLLASGSSIREVAKRYEFHDQFHFSKRFKRAFGISPREFRRRVLGGNPVT